MEDRGGTPSSQGDFRELAAPGFLANWPHAEHLRLETSRDGGEPWTRSVGRFRRKLDLVNFPDRRGPTDGCGESVGRGPLTPCTGLRDPRPTTSRGPGPLTAAELSGRGSRGRGHRPRDLRIQGLDLENFRPRHGCGESVRRGPLTPCTGLRDPRPTTDDLPRTGTSDRCRTLRTWESGPAGTGLGTSGSQAWT